jgi:hypothetical protein
MRFTSNFILNEDKGFLKEIVELLKNDYVSEKLNFHGPLHWNKTSTLKHLQLPSTWNINVHFTFHCGLNFNELLHGINYRGSLSDILGFDLTKTKYDYYPILPRIEYVEGRTFYCLKFSQASKIPFKKPIGYTSTPKKKKNLSLKEEDDMLHMFMESFEEEIKSNQYGKNTSSIHHDLYMKSWNVNSSSLSVSDLPSLSSSDIVCTSSLSTSIGLTENTAASLNEAAPKNNGESQKNSIRNKENGRYKFKHLTTQTNVTVKENSNSKRRSVIIDSDSE